jgi:hypothetical protein
MLGSLARFGGSMPKLTARKLADRIRERLKEPKLRVAVFFDRARGWRAVAYGSVDIVSEQQKRIDEVVNEFRDVYDLDPEE